MPVLQAAETMIFLLMLPGIFPFLCSMCTIRYTTTFTIYINYVPETILNVTPFLQFIYHDKDCCRISNTCAPLHVQNICSCICLFFRVMHVFQASPKPRCRVQLCALHQVALATVSDFEVNAGAPQRWALATKTVILIVNPREIEALFIIFTTCF